MLLYLTNYLAQFESGFNVFNYLTMRAILGALTALVISFVIGPRMIAKLSMNQVGQPVREEGPVTHLPKAGTPTMGWCADSDGDCGQHGALGGPREHVRLGRAVCDVVLRRHRLRRRLQETHIAGSGRDIGRAKALLAVCSGNHRCHCFVRYGD